MIEIFKYISKMSLFGSILVFACLTLDGGGTLDLLQVPLEDTQYKFKIVGMNIMYIYMDI